MIRKVIKEYLLFPLGIIRWMIPILQRKYPTPEKYGVYDLSTEQIMVDFALSQWEASLCFIWGQMNSVYLSLPWLSTAGRKKRIVINEKDVLFLLKVFLMFPWWDAISETVYKILQYNMDETPCGQIIAL